MQGKYTLTPLLSNKIVQTCIFHLHLHFPTFDLDRHIIKTDNQSNTVYNLKELSGQIIHFNAIFDKKCQVQQMIFF